ncbi:MAG TPA: FHA domain-containing protein, partial [Ktedonosporobacter sp.]|nr:FHA domain-containing protein [Ktedonosporobacter sp.]
MDIEQKPVTDVAIRFLTGPLETKIMPVKQLVTVIGRDPTSDIVILDQRVSRRHACIRWQGGAWTIENLSQTSFIALNQQRVQQGTLAHNSIVQIGEGVSFAFLIQPPVAQSSRPLNAAIATEPMPRGPQASSDIESRRTVRASEPGSGLPSLTVSSNIHSDRQQHMLNKPLLTIGRDAANDIVIAESIISSHHVQIEHDGQDFYLVHPHPSRQQTVNGLWYQGQLITGNQKFRRRLVNGDIFRIGDEHGTLITLVYDDGTGMSPETLPEMPSIALNDSRLTLGRVADNTVVLNHPQVSAHHAALEKVEGGYRVVDTNSTNHVYVNGQPVVNQLLRTGDEIRIGPYRLTYTGTELKQYNESSNIRIDAKHLKKVGNNAVILLNDIS